MVANDCGEHRVLSISVDNKLNFVKQHFTE